MTDQPPVEPDDLSGWADDDLVRALRAPGTPTELADEERYVAAYRGAHRSNVRSLPRRAAGRLGAGGTAVVVTVALTSGVAAAYTGHLPDPVQQIAHSVIGAPAPDPDGRHHVTASGPHGGPVATRSAGPDGTASSAPTDGTTTGSTASPDGPTSPDTSPAADAHHGKQHPSPSGEPSPSTSTSAPSSDGSPASAMTVSAPAHRVDLGGTMTLTGLVTDASGAPLPGHVVVLQERGRRHWRAVVETKADSTGVASAETPAVTRSTRFRWHADRGVNSAPWFVGMIPTLTLSADVGGSTTTLTPSAQGSAAGDRIQVFRHRAGRTTLVRRARLDAGGSAQVSVVTPRRRTAYVVRLLGTRRHAPVRARVVVVPPPPAALTISGSAGRVDVGGSAVIGGAVTSASGSALPGHRVVLLRRGPARWRAVGHAVSDATGQVSIATPPITATTRFRLRTDHGVHSQVWRVVEVPALSASAQRGNSSVTITATASGAQSGDKVVLLRRSGGQLVRMRHAALGAGGSVSFSVPPRHVRTTYVLRLVGTKRHAAATASVTVPKAG